MKNTKFLKFFQAFLTNCLCQMGLFNAVVYLTDCAAHRPFHFDLLVGLVVPIVCGVISAMMVVGGIGRKRNQLEGR